MQAMFTVSGLMQAMFTVSGNMQAMFTVSGCMKAMFMVSNQLAIANVSILTWCFCINDCTI